MTRDDVERLVYKFEDGGPDAVLFEVDQKAIASAKYLKRALQNYANFREKLIYEIAALAKMHNVEVDPIGDLAACDT